MTYEPFKEGDDAWIIGACVYIGSMTFKCRTNITKVMADSFNKINEDHCEKFYRPALFHTREECESIKKEKIKQLLDDFLDAHDAKEVSDYASEIILGRRGHQLLNDIQDFLHDYDSLKKSDKEDP